MQGVFLDGLRNLDTAAVPQVRCEGRGATTNPRKEEEMGKERMREELHTGGVQRKRDILRSFVDRIEGERERARLWYTFPLLEQRVFYSMPPGVFETKDFLVCEEIELIR